MAPKQIILKVRAHLSGIAGSLGFGFTKNRKHGTIAFINVRDKVWRIKSGDAEMVHGQCLINQGSNEFELRIDPAELTCRLVVNGQKAGEDVLIASDPYLYNGVVLHFTNIDEFTLTGVEVVARVDEPSDG